MLDTIACAFSLSEALSAETAISVVLSLIITATLYGSARYIPPLQKLLLPGADEQRDGESVAGGILRRAKDPKQSATMEELRLAADLLKSSSNRGNGVLIGMAVIFVGTLNAVAPAVSLLM